MKQILLIFLSLISHIALCQNNTDWVVFYSKGENLMGYKDQKGVVKIKPKFCGFTVAEKFKDIIGVREVNTPTDASYYLLKNGQKVGEDSMFVFDMAFDCESEGFIRFREPKLEKVGMFNYLGQIAIPAEYDGLTQMRNGLAVGVKGAKKEALGEHSILVGGIKSLIDSHNAILVDSFETVEGLDYYSLKIEDSPSHDTCRLNYKGKNGKYYTFIDNKKYFTEWLFSEFMNDLSQQNLMKQAHHTLILSQKNKNRLGKSNFIINKYYDLIYSKIADIKSNKDFYLFIESYIDEHLKKEFDTYYDNCGDLNTTKYPVMEYILNYHHGRDFYQNLFTFLKTEAGYKLVSLTIRY